MNSLGRPSTGSACTTVHAMLCEDAHQRSTSVEPGRGENVQQRMCRVSVRCSGSCAKGRAGLAQAPAAQRVGCASSRGSPSCVRVWRDLLHLQIDDLDTLLAPAAEHDHPRSNPDRAHARHADYTLMWILPGWRPTADAADAEVRLRHPNGQ